MNPITDINRTPGFSSVAGENSINYASANEAFNAYLNATGQKLSKREKNMMFKEWLKTAKQSGNLDKVVMTKDKIKTAVEEKVSQNMTEENESSAAGDEIKTDTTKPKKIMGMPPMVAIGVTVAAIGLISWGIYVLYKKSKANDAAGATGGTGGAPAQ